MKKVICTLIIIGLLSAIIIGAVNARTFFHIELSVNQISTSNDLTEASAVPLNTVGLVTASYVGSFPSSDVQVNVTWSSNPSGPWSNEQIVIPLQVINNDTSASNAFTFNHAGYYNFTMYSTMHNSVSRSLPPLEATVGPVLSEPLGISAVCISVALIGALSVRKKPALTP
jgi:hypothetical protein